MISANHDDLFESIFQEFLRILRTSWPLSAEEISYRERRAQWLDGFPETARKAKELRASGQVIVASQLLADYRELRPRRRRGPPRSAAPRSFVLRGLLAEELASTALATVPEEQLRESARNLAHKLLPKTTN